MQIISVNITKGGCGKTTTVQMIAEILGKAGKRVLCVDTDPQCNLTLVSGINLMDWKKNNLYTLLKKECKLKDCIAKSTYYDVLVGSIFLASADAEFTQLGRECLLKDCLEDADYDLILIDTPPSLGILNIMSLTASTAILIPTECSYLAMLGLDQLYNTIQSIRKYSNPALELTGILLIKYNPRTNLTNAMLSGFEEMATRMNSKIFNTKIRETIKVKEAQSQKIPILDWEDNISAVDDYIEFVKELGIS